MSILVPVSYFNTKRTKLFRGLAGLIAIAGVAVCINIGFAADLVILVPMNLLFGTFAIGGYELLNRLGW